jgi:hypothetical protein
MKKARAGGSKTPSARKFSKNRKNLKKGVDNPVSLWYYYKVVSERRKQKVNMGV